MNFRFSYCCFVLSAALTALSATAASAGTTALGHFMPIQSMLAPKAVRKLYVVDTTHGQIDLFRAGVANPKIIGTITKGVVGPLDVFVDHKGTLYVLNTGSVAIYAAGASEPERTITLDELSGLYVTAGPNGTVYVMGEKSNGLWRVEEYDLGAKKPSRTIRIPNEYPYALQGAGIAVDDNNNLYMNSGSYSGQGDFYITIYPPKKTKASGGFSSGGYAGGGVQVFSGNCLVGDPGDDNIEVWPLPIGKNTRPTFFSTESAGDFLTLDVVSDYLYAVSYGTQTLQIYNFKNGHLLNFLSGFSRGVAVDPPATFQ